jgi:hypothetical protein
VVDHLGTESGADFSVLLQAEEVIAGQFGHFISFSGLLGTLRFAQPTESPLG